MATVDDVFEETSDVPAGRKSRMPSKALAAKIDESAKRGVAFSRVGSPADIAELRRDLQSATVRKDFEVTTSTAKMENGQEKLTFAAKRKAKEPAPKAESAK